VSDGRLKLEDGLAKGVRVVVRCMREPWLCGWCWNETCEMGTACQLHVVSDDARCANAAG